MLQINVVGGLIRGLKLQSSKNENLRPTKDRIKESLFDILSFDIEGKVFLDLFGGTGQIGIEAFSRGAKEVHIVEAARENIKLIKNNISKIKCKHNIKLSNMDAIEFLKMNKQEIDIAFIDPPYKNIQLLQNAMDLAATTINKNGIIITETSLQNTQNKVKDFSLHKKYKYGSIFLNVYKNDI